MGQEHMKREARLRAGLAQPGENQGILLLVTAD